jgi:hypothetical protein
VPTKNTEAKWGRLKVIKVIFLYIVWTLLQTQGEDCQKIGEKINKELMTCREISKNNYKADDQHCEFSLKITISFVHF